MRWIPPLERAKKSKLQAPERLRGVIPAKAEIYLSSWNKLLHGSPPARGRRCGPHIEQFPAFFTCAFAASELLKLKEYGA
jgi:hypothetical protein